MPNTFRTAAKLGKVQTDPAQPGVTIIPDAGSLLVIVNLGESDIANPIRVTLPQPGVGIECVRGFGLMRKALGGSSTIPHPTSNVRLSLLPSGTDDADIGYFERHEWRSDRGDLYDGRIISARFERLAVRVYTVSLGSFKLTESLVFRVYTAAGYRPVPVSTQTWPGCPVLDVYNGKILAWEAGVDQTIYDDTVPSFTEDVAGVPGEWGHSGHIDVGKGMGHDFRVGPTYSWKRKLWGHVSVDTALAGTTLDVTIYGMSGTSTPTWRGLHSFTARTVSDTAGTTIARVTDYMSTLRNLPMTCPSAIRIVARCSITAAGASWLSFIGDY